MIPDLSTLSTVASIISGFGVAMLFFRIQRELQMQEKDETIWIPAADWLLISATLMSLLLVIFPIVAVSKDASIAHNIASSACSASSILVAGYIFSILAHYRLLFGRHRTGPRDNPEPAEKTLVRLTIVIAAIVFIVVFMQPR